MNRRKLQPALSVTALVFSIVAIGLAIIVRADIDARQQMESIMGQAPAIIEAKLDVLASRLDVYGRALEALESNSPEGTAIVDEETALRLADLEAKVEGLYFDYLEWAVDRGDQIIEDLGRPGTRVETTALLSFQATVLNDNTDGRLRVEALRMLTRFPEEVDALGPIWPAVPSLYADLEDEHSRENLIDRLDGHFPPESAAFLLDSLESEESSSVRVEIVRALAKLVDSAFVRNALELAASEDSSEDVRRAAKGALRVSAGE